METNRILHDFGELTHEDIEDLSTFRSPKNVVQSNPYTFLVAALALGLLLGLLTHRK